MLTNFSPLREVDLLMPGSEDALFMSFTKESNLRSSEIHVTRMADDFLAERKQQVFSFLFLSVFV